MGGKSNINHRKKKGFMKKLSRNKKSKDKKLEVVNKKAIFNRYKNKQKLEEAIEKKQYLEQSLKRKNEPDYSDSEVEDNPYEDLVTSLNVKTNKVPIHSSDSEEEELESGNGNDHIQNDNDEQMDEQSGEESDGLDVQSDVGEDEIEDVTKNNNLDLNDDDPFIRHLEYEIDDQLLVSMTTPKPITENHTKNWPVLGNMSVVIPKPVAQVQKLKPKISILEEKKYAPPVTVPNLVSKVDMTKLNIKSQIQNNVVPANKKNLVKRDVDFGEILTPIQNELFTIMNNYQDLFYTDRTFTNADEIRFTYCLHIVNHVLKSRLKIIHHNAKLAKKANMEEFHDQGLVRPKVLVVVPFKDAAYRVINTLIEILVPKESGQVVNKKRFEDEFTGGELLMPRKNPKPEDYELLFSGNTDDTFRVGMSVTKKTLKLFTDFYSSDIIVASPLGLRMIIGAEGEVERDYDFLASIEMLVIDQADVFLMQNWDHLMHILEHCHLQPKKTHDTDFSRVRSWAVNGWAKYYRQTLIFSSVAMPEIKSLLNKKCQNYAGKVVVQNVPDVGSIRQVVLQIPQIFHRFTASNPLQSVDSRFNHFVKEILPKQRDPLMNHTLIYVPSYFDYVRIRNYFKKEDIGFVQICEYSKDAKIARARDMFFHSEAHFLLYSERVHFFRRFRVKGIRHIIFYQPPTYPYFYSELCNLMQESNQNKYGGSECNMTVTVLYSAYDVHQLSAIVGSTRASSMLRSDKTVHMYLTGD